MGVLVMPKPSQGKCSPVPFHRALKKSGKRDRGGAEPGKISTQVHCQLKTSRRDLGRATTAAHETGIKLEKQFYVLVVII